MGEADTEHAASDVGFELCSRSLGGDPPVIDDGDLLRQAVGLLELMGGEQHGGALLA